MSIKVIELRNTLESQHGWSRKKATLAARYYTGVDNLRDLQACAKEAPAYRDVAMRPLLTEKDVTEIIHWR